MKIQLSKDSLFDKKQSSSVSKDVRSKQRQKLRLIKNEKMNSSMNKPQINIEVVDPLPQQLKKYRNQIQYKKTHQASKASHVLKKYIMEQQRNLKRVRLEKLQLDDDEISLSPKRSQLHLDIDSSSQKSDKSPEQINIPRIQQVFKDQQKQYVLFQSKLMRDRLKKAYNTVENGVKVVGSYYRGLSTVPLDSRKTSFAEKFPSINPQQVRSINSYENQYEIDHIIERKLTMSKKLRDKLYQQKRQMMSLEAKQAASKSKSLNFYIPPPKRTIKKVPLQGVKAITLNRGNEKIKVTLASSLLFSLNRMSVGHEKKEQQLQQLVHNSYFNRNSTLSEKSDFYDQETPFSDLSPSNQFRLRKLMDKRLLHRLQLSKQQTNKFSQYLSQIKDTYHVILNDQILQVLRQIRQTLLTGKVMKSADLSEILKTKNKKYLTGHPNDLIIQKLSQMMI